MHAVTETGRTFTFQVDGLPPAKSEAKSMLAAGHPHASRVVALLDAAADASVTGGAHFGGSRMGMRVELTYAGERPSDLSNYLGGIADVLEEKGRRMGLAHLGPLAHVALYDNDRQIGDISMREQAGDHTSYTVCLWEL